MNHEIKPISRWWLSCGATIFLLTVTWMNRGRFMPSPQTTNTSTTEPTATDNLITKAEAVIAQKPTTVRPYTILASYYLQKARETADSAYYARIDTLMDKATAIDAKDASIYAMQSSVAAGRHDFQKALQLANEATTHNPDTIAYLGLKADAEIELGQYDAATATLQQMVDKRPDANVFTRIAYIREIYGDIPGAIAALEQASSAASMFPENRAWIAVELGKLYMRHDPKKAQEYFDGALTILPHYSPALKWQGMVAAWQGDLPTARQLVAEALYNLPVAEYSTDLGNIYTLNNEQAKASQQYALSRIAYTRSLEIGVNVDQELANFLADQNTDLDLALTKAQAAYQNRPNIFSADALSWVWYQKADYAKAGQYSHEALRLGEHDATIVFHAGMIAAKKQNTAEAKRLLAKSLELNPYFSLLQVPVAKDTLQQLK